MAIAQTLAVALRGIDGQLVEVQAHLSAGLPGLSFTGLADAAVLESRERIRSAILNSGVRWPDQRITVALLPADVRKVGSRFDLALAVAVLAGAGELDLRSAGGTAWIAELGLDGRLRPVRGVLPAVIAARRQGLRRVVVAEANGSEAALVCGVEVVAARDLAEVIGWLSGSGRRPPAARVAAQQEAPPSNLDLADVAGQCGAKRALEIAAAGSHHLYMLGQPGAGKTMLAQRLGTILPSLTDEVALEVTAVHSVAGRLGTEASLLRRPPFQAPHHSASAAALVGGGSGVANPGAISLAHHGILFLDEAPQFSPAVLDGLRQPLESGTIVLHRSAGVVSYPARFLLVLAANPCSCGAREKDCTCSPHSRRRYQQRLSGPLLDRVDLRIRVDPVPNGALLDDTATRETSTQVRERVEQARASAATRWRELGHGMNSEVPGGVLRSTRWRPARAALKVAETYLERGELTARGFDRVLRLSWTIADLAGRVSPEADDVAEAVYLRTGMANLWAA